MKSVSRRMSSRVVHVPSYREVEKKLFYRGVTDRERAVFEGGIALAALYHQFLGTPVARKSDVLRKLRDAIETTLLLQPYRKKVAVKILRSTIKSEKKHPYDYETLKGRHLDVTVVTRYGRAEATVRMKHVPELDFNLMYVEKLRVIGKNEHGQAKRASAAV